MFEIFRGTDGDVLEKTEYFDVMSHNDNLREKMRRDFKQKQRILVNGYLNNYGDADETGKICRRCFIEATNISKVQTS